MCTERQEDSSITMRHNAFPDAPIPSINATLAHLDLNGFRFRLHGFREMHVKHPVLGTFCVIRYELLTP